MNETLVEQLIEKAYVLRANVPANRDDIIECLVGALKALDYTMDVKVTVWAGVVDNIEGPVSLCMDVDYLDEHGEPEGD